MRYEYQTKVFDGTIGCSANRWLYGDPVHTTERPVPVGTMVDGLARFEERPEYDDATILASQHTLSEIFPQHSGLICALDMADDWRGHPLGRALYGHASVRLR